MKTAEQLKAIAEDAKKDMLGAIPNIQLSIERNDWESTIQYATALIVGATSINCVEGTLDNGVDLNQYRYPDDDE